MSKEDTYSLEEAKQHFKNQGYKETDEIVFYRGWFTINETGECVKANVEKCPKEIREIFS